MGVSHLSAEKYLPKYTEYIYSLRCPLTYSLFYVGKTANLKSRLTGHISEAHSAKNKMVDTYKNDLIRSICKYNVKPIMTIIDYTEIRTTIDQYESIYKELYWIKFYYLMGWELANRKEVNANLSQTEFEKYNKIKKSGNVVPLHYYYFSRDEHGDSIYDKVRLSKDGFSIKETDKEPVQKPKYNPWDNPRFRKMLGIEDKVEETYWYRDTDPNYFDDDY